MTGIRASRARRPKTRAVVVGGGFIGLEMVENLVHRGFDVTLVEMLDQVLPPLDPELARVVEAHLKRHGDPPGARRRGGRVQAGCDMAPSTCKPNPARPIRLTS